MFIQVINLYWQNNPFTHIYIFGDSQNGIDDDGNGEIDEPGENIPIKQEVNGFPLLPTIGFKIDF